MFGGMKATDASGKTVEYVWDYAADEPVLKKEMPLGSDRWKASEKAKENEMQPIWICVGCGAWNDYRCSPCWRCRAKSLCR